MEDRQVQHIFESNATSAALAPNIACHIFINPVIIPRVHKRVLKLVNFEVQKVQKPELFDLVDTSPWLRDGH